MAEPYRRRQCVHYTAPGTTCHAGISIDPQLMDSEGRIPCVEIRGISGAIPCDRRSMPPPAPADAPGSMTRALEALEQGKCPKCDGAIRGVLELDGQVLAMPCRHVLRSPKTPT